MITISRNLYDLAQSARLNVTRDNYEMAKHDMEELSRRIINEDTQSEEKISVPKVFWSKIKSAIFALENDDEALAWISLMEMDNYLHEDVNHAKLKIA